MDFYEKYELIDPLPGEGTKSFRARQIASGRDVVVHVLVGGKTAENEALLGRLRNLPPEALRKLLEVGDNEGVTYVVTEAPPYRHLGEWLGDQEHGSGASDAAKFTRAGAWKIPTAPPAAPAPVAHAPQLSEPGEFTLMFQKAAAKAEQSERAEPLPPVVPPPAPSLPPMPPPTPVASASAPGEFTRMFQAVPLDEAPAPFAEARKPAAEAPLSAPGELPPGSVTQTMEMPAPIRKPAPGSGTPVTPKVFSPSLPLEPATPGGTFAMQSPSSVSTKPGEFTAMFQAATVVPSAPMATPDPPKAPPVPPPAAAPQESGPGEFTSMFRTAPPAPAPEPALPQAPAVPPAQQSSKSSRVSGPANSPACFVTPWPQVRRKRIRLSRLPRPQRPALLARASSQRCSNRRRPWLRVSRRGYPSRRVLQLQARIRVWGQPATSMRGRRRGWLIRIQRRRLLRLPPRRLLERPASSRKCSARRRPWLRLSRRRQFHRFRQVLGHHRGFRGSRRQRVHRHV